MSELLQLSGVKILRTGADGGRLYIRGRAELPEHGECDFHAFFRTKEEERDFESQFSGQSVVIETDGVEYAPGMGGSAQEIAAWRFV